MATTQHGPFRPTTAAADLSAKRHRAVKLTGARTVNVCGAGDRAFGILNNAPASGERADVQIYDQTKWEAGAAFGAGVDLTPDANGKAVAAGPGDFVTAVSVEASGGDGQIVSVELRGSPAASATPTYLALDIADGSADATYYLVAPHAGNVTKLRSVIDGAVGTADITITPNIGATPITNGALTIATAGSAAGDVDVATPTAANTVTAGQAINLVVAGGGSGGSPRVHVVVELTP